MFPTLPTLLQPVSLPFKRAQLGLFHGALKQSGNNVPFSKRKTKRTWLPNVQQKKLSLVTNPKEKVGEPVRVKVTTRALRTIHKSGGLANYVLNTRNDILGPTGMALRMRVRDAHASQLVQSQELQKKRQQEREDVKRRSIARINRRALARVAALESTLLKEIEPEVAMLTS